MKKQTRKTFKLSQTSVAVMMATASMAGTQFAYAGVGFGDGVDQDGVTPVRVQAYFAHSPSGDRRAIVPEAAAIYPAGDVRLISTGKALRKFVDPLPLPLQSQTMADGATQRTIPVAVATKWTNPEGGATSDDYYEIAVVEYTMRWHSDLPKETLMRGYVQIDHQASNGRPALPGSASLPLTYPDGTPIMINGTDANGKMTGTKVQALAVAKPEFLGPTILATKDVPTRVKFLNLLPSGRAELTGAFDAFGQVEVGKRNGDLFLPVDKSLMGAGYGPDGMTEYTQNRAVIHLHGGDTPWISDGTPHQWIAPIDENDATKPGTLAADAASGIGMDPTYLPNFVRGAGAVNVPDMNDPGDGAMTYYFPNGQSARMLWYHDHTSGLTRVNVIAGEAAGYLLTDDVEKSLMADDAIQSGAAARASTGLPIVLPPFSRTIPLVLQDRGFVPDDIALQDAKWNTTAWGAPGDSWFPHVYETVQDPAQANNFNAVGRWHYGPWFWPVFPALYTMPTGEYGDVTTTPEAWSDTGAVNGVAYPTLDVDPTTYRFKILNASNDRSMTVNLFVADTTQAAPFPGRGQTVAGAHYTEVAMVPAAVPTPDKACAPGVVRPVALAVPAADGSTVCTPETWPTDQRNGGVPSPAAVGPTLYQIASEGGFLPQLATIEPTPINYNYDRGRITVLNVDTPALYLGNAERADVVVDFSQYAGKTLIVYSDSPAPVPAGDPRNDYFTGVGDQSPSGGAEDTLVGYGPNTRTMMQIRVAATMPGAAAAPTAADAFDPAALAAALPVAYAQSQPRPVVGQSGYNAAFNNAYPTTDLVGGAYASIFVGSLKEPQFKYTPGIPGLWDSVKVTAVGAGYITPPDVVFNGSGTGATANATLKISAITVLNPGSGYTVAPVVSIVAQGGGGTGATAVASLGVVGVNLTNVGSGYTAAPAVTFSMPQDPAGIQAQGYANIGGPSGTQVTGIVVTNPGKGYASLPTVSIAAATDANGVLIPGAIRARATVVAGVTEVTLTAPDANNPASAGGGGYTRMDLVSLTFTAPNVAGGVRPRTQVRGSVFDVTMVNYGTGYGALDAGGVAAPTTISLNGGGLGAGGATADVALGGSVLVKTKAIHELFEPTFGRMNAILAVELPFTSAMTQTTIPLAYIDAPTEIFENGETQIWKITHNGVDTHPVHFHLLNVQLINRVGWDGWISPPTANELGWKETVKMNPLEDVIVAVRAKTPPLKGFGLPHSVRPMDPTQPLGSPFGFTQIDPMTGNPAAVANKVIDYGWEYVWHCHILGHEENDFMRPVVFKAKEVAPTAPTTLAANSVLGAGTQLTWTDTAVTEFRFDVMRSAPNMNAFTKVGQALANASTFTDATAVTGEAYDYQVVAVGQNGTAASATVTLIPAGVVAPDAPMGLAATFNGVSTINLVWTDVATNEAGYTVERSLDGGVTWTLVASLPVGAQAFADVGAQFNTAYAYRVSAFNVIGTAPSLTSITTSVLAVTGAVATRTPTTVNLTWTLPVQGALTEIQVLRNGTLVATLAATATGFADIGLTPSTDYTYTVVAVGVAGTAPAALLVHTPALLAAGTGVVASLADATTAQINWTDASVGETGYQVEMSVNGSAVWTTVATIAGFANTGAVSTMVPGVYANGSTYRFRVVALDGALVSALSGTSTINLTTLPSRPAILSRTAVAGGQVNLSWSDTGRTNNDRYELQVRTQTAGVWGAWSNLPNVGGNASSYAATGLTTGQNVQFQIRAGNVRGVSQWRTSTAVVVQ